MANRALRKSLYRLTQEELLVQIKRECIAEGVEFKEDEYGNIWSIRYEGKPTFVAHCDTVIGDDRFYKAPLVENGGKLFRPGHVLGADDRAGVNLILNHKKDINFIFTKDEEIGCLGANFLASYDVFLEDAKKTTFFIELDRKGNSDIIGSLHGYCDDELSEKISEVLKGYSDTYGVLTDIDSFVDICQGVNLSIGYYNAHTKNEYLVISEFDAINDKILELSEIVIDRRVCESSSYLGKYSYSGISSSWWRRTNPYYDRYFHDDAEVCDFCGAQDDTIYDYKGSKVCEACAVGLPEEELYESGDTYFSEAEGNGKCSNCGNYIWLEEEFVYIKDWNVRFCKNCFTKEHIKL